MSAVRVGCQALSFVLDDCRLGQYAENLQSWEEMVVVGPAQRVVAAHGRRAGGTQEEEG